MAESSHVEIVKAGREAFQIWRDQHLGTVLDLGGANLSNQNLDGYDLSGAILAQADLTSANLANARLEQADLTGAKCERTIFNQADLCSIKYEEATFRGAQFTNASLPLGLLRQTDCRDASFGPINFPCVDLSGRDFSGCNFASARLPGARLVGSTLRSVIFQGCDLHGADLSDVDCEGARFDEAMMTGASLRNASLTGATFSRADLARADISQADFHEAILNDARMERIRGAPRARNLSSTRIAQEVHYFDSAVLSHWDWLDWEKVRIAGRLPLFAASYSVLIAIPLFFYVLEIYNDKVGLIRGWAKQELSGAGITDYYLAQMVLQKLHPLPPPALSELLLISTIILAFGASIYALACPSRVKEFSRDQWAYQLGHSVVHYMAAAWSRRPWRLAALAFYILGGLGAAIVLASKLTNVAIFLLKQSDVVSLAG
jgi:uncharacterized protein YjbI with pentapeptide repeats